MRLTSLSFISASIPLLLCATLACGDSGGVTSGGSATDSGSGSTTDTGTSTTSSTSGATTTDSAGSGSDSASTSSTSSTTEAATTDPATSTTTGTSTSSTTEPGTSTTSTTDDSTSSTTDTSTTSTSDTTDTTTTGVLEDCTQWQAAFDAEVQEIRGCNADAECGQVLQGTSCGCTRNWVARLDADPAEFWALVDVAMNLGCDLPFFSTCDCPITDGFACVGGICTWNYT